MKRWLLALACLAACRATPVYTEGVPHLLKVEGVPNLYRSGQPLDEAAVRYLAQSLHVQWVWKLNRWNEGDTDKSFEKYGVHVEYQPIPPFTDLRSLDDYVDVIEGPNAEQWRRLVSSVQYVWAHPEITFLVHCVNGNDRTGAFSGLANLRVKTPQQAYDYMRATGFHWELIGLRDGWWQTANTIWPITTSYDPCLKDDPWFFGCRAFIRLCTEDSFCPR